MNRFLLGRQQVVVPLGFVVAQITAFSGYTDSGAEHPQLGGVMNFLLVTLGLPGIVVLLQVSQLLTRHHHDGHVMYCILTITVTINIYILSFVLTTNGILMVYISTCQFSQLAPQLLAAANKDVFLRLPGASGLVYLALAIESLGLTEVSTALSRVCDHLCCVSATALTMTAVSSLELPSIEPNEGKGGGGTLLLIFYTIIYTYFIILFLYQTAVPGILSLVVIRAVAAAVTIIIMMMWRLPPLTSMLRHSFIRITPSLTPVTVTLYANSSIANREYKILPIERIHIIYISIPILYVFYIRHYV